MPPLTAFSGFLLSHGLYVTQWTFPTSLHPTLSPSILPSSPHRYISSKSCKHSACPPPTPSLSENLDFVTYSSTLTKHTNKPLVTTWHGNFSVFMSLSLTSQVPATPVLLPLCLPFPGSITDSPSQTSPLRCSCSPGYGQKVPFLLFCLLSLCIFPHFQGFKYNQHTIHSILPIRHFCVKKSMSQTALVNLPLY